MRLGKYSQCPNDRRRYKIEYDEWLDTGELLLDVTFAVTPVTSPTLRVEDHVLADTDTSVKFYILGGDVAGTKYTLTVTATTADGQTKQDTVLFTMVDP